MTQVGVTNFELLYNFNCNHVYVTWMDGTVINNTNFLFRWAKCFFNGTSHSVNIVGIIYAR